MKKHFLTQIEQETILRAYSMDFEKELHRVSPYCFESLYGYTINICPEIDERGKETGRILVNHYSADKIPKFIDVWERTGGGIYFKYRNLSIPVKSLNDENEILKAQINALTRLEAYRTIISEKLQGGELRKYCEKLAAQRESLLKLYNDTAVKNLSYMREKDEYFRQSEEYVRLTVERDQLAKSKAESDKELKKVKESLRKAEEEIIEIKKAKNEYMKNVGRKKYIDKKNETLRMYAAGTSITDIAKVLEISRMSVYRYLREEGIIKYNQNV